MLQALRVMRARTLRLRETCISVKVDGAFLWIGVSWVHASPVAAQMAGMPPVLNDSLLVLESQQALHHHMDESEIYLQVVRLMFVPETDFRTDIPSLRRSCEQSRIRG
jgi:hypothetical protein